jgi:hypothetical protein
MFCHGGFKVQPDRLGLRGRLGSPNEAIATVLKKNYILDNNKKKNSIFTDFCPFSPLFSSSRETLEPGCVEKKRSNGPIL